MNTTPTMLGPEATQDDAELFDAAVEAIIEGASYEGVTIPAEDARAFIWNDGDCWQRMQCYGRGGDDSDANGEWAGLIARFRP